MKWLYGKKGQVCVPKLPDGLMDHLPPERASPGFCPGSQSLGFYSVKRKRLPGHKGQAHLEWNPSHSNSRRPSPSPPGRLYFLVSKLA